MKRYRDYLLITDIDGTLNNDSHLISDKNKAAIDFFTANGGSFAVATGRSQFTAAAFINQLKEVNAPCIFYNGAMLYDWTNSSIICARYVNSPELTAYLQFVQKRYPEIAVQVYTEQGFFVLDGESAIDEQIYREEMDFQHAQLSDLINKSWVKVMLYHSNRFLLEECGQCMADFGLDGKANHFFSAPWYFEIVDCNASKGDMLNEIRWLPQYKNKKIFAAGDFQNDIKMLQQADYGIAPANAEPDVKAVADMVSVDNNHHLMYEIIYNIMTRQ